MHARTVLAAALLGACAAFADEVDGVAARVGSAVILRSDVESEMRRAGFADDRFDEVRDAMIERELVLQAATEAKMQMQDWVVENRIREIVDRAFGGDRNKLMEVLAKDKISYPEWRQRIKDDMVVAAMRWQVVDKNIQATPSAMREEYAAHPERYVADRRVTVSTILLLPGDAEKSAEIDAALAKGVPFAELAKKHSADSKASEGGRWEDIKPEEVFRPEICSEIAKLPKDALSGWIELDGWKTLLRKDGESGGDRMPFAEAYDAVAANVRDAESRRLYDDWIKRLKREAYIKLY